MLQTTTTLAELATKHPAASRVFYRHGFDFCCHGNRPLEEACKEAGIPAAAIVHEIEAEDRNYGDSHRWDERPLPDLISYIVTYYHRRLREELPLLVEMADKVERVHADKPSRPAGLRDHLTAVHSAVLDHLAKEERVLFPMILAGRESWVSGPIHMMEIEHDDHAESLKRTRMLTTNLIPPAEACTTWKALYKRLEEFELELMEHIHLENNVLFRRALCEGNR